MTDELAPTPVKKRKRVHKGTPPSEKPGPTKKLKSTISTNDRPSSPPKTKHPVQKNAKAGPSSQKKSTPSGTPARFSSRVSRPTMKKVAALTMSKKKSAPAEDSTDSSRTPSPNVSSRNSLKKQPTFDKAISKCELTPKRKVHLGAIELSSGSEEDICRRPLKKRVKSAKKPPSEIIDLCSDDDPLPKKDSQNHTDLDDVVVILSTDDEDEPPVIPKPRAGVSQVKAALLKEIHPGPPQLSTAHSLPVLVNAEVEEMAQIPHDCFLVVDSVDSPRPGSPPSTDVPHVELECSAASAQHPDVTLDSLQASYRDAMDSQIFDAVKEQNNQTRAHISPFSTTSFSAPPRVITFSDDVPTLCLQTPNYFSRTILSINRSASVKKKSTRAISIETDIPLLALANVSQPELSWTSHDFDHGTTTATHAVDRTAPLKEPFSRCQSVPNQEPQEPSLSKTSSSNDDPLTEILSMTGENNLSFELSADDVASSTIVDSCEIPMGIRLSSHRLVNALHGLMTSKKPVNRPVPVRETPFAFLRPTVSLWDKPAEPALIPEEYVSPAIDANGPSNALPPCASENSEPPVLKSQSTYDIVLSSISEISQPIQESLVVNPHPSTATLGDSVNLLPGALPASASPSAESQNSIGSFASLEESPSPLTPLQMQATEPLIWSAPSAIEIAFLDTNLSKIIGSSKYEEDDDDDDDNMSLSGLEFAYPEELC